MEIFDDETYEIMEKEYQKALSSSPLGGLNRAVKGELPFKLKENEKRADTLIECARLNKRLYTLCSTLSGYRAEVLRSLVAKNAEELPKVDEDSVIEIKRYENPFIKISYALICALEEAKAEQKGLSLLVCRTYAIMSAFFGT